MKLSSFAFRHMLLFSSLTVVSLVACKKSNNDTVVDDRLTITSFTPAQAAEYDTVKIHGARFSTTKSANAVEFNGLTAEVTAASATELTVVVPESAVTGKISLTVNGEKVLSATDFKVVPGSPVIKSLSAKAGAKDDEIEVNGNRFTQQTKFYFEEVAAAQVTFINSHKVKLKVPAVKFSGAIRAEDITGSGVSADTFRIKDSWLKINAGFGSSDHSNGGYFVYKNEMYLAFGGGDVTNRQIHIFNPDNKSWRVGPALPGKVPGRNRPVIQLVGSKIYFGAGVGNESLKEYMKDFWIYDPTKTGDEAWSRKADFPIPFAGGASFTNGIDFVAGFGENAGLYTSSLFFRFNPDGVDGPGTWSQSGNWGNWQTIGKLNFFTIKNIGYFGLNKFSGYDNAQTYYGYSSFENLPGVLFHAAQIPRTGISSCSMNDKGYVVGDDKMYVFDPNSGWSDLMGNQYGEFLFNIKNVLYVTNKNGVTYEYIPVN